MKSLEERQADRKLRKAAAKSETTLSAQATASLQDEALKDVETKDAAAGVKSAAPAAKAVKPAKATPASPFAPAKK